MKSVNANSGPCSSGWVSTSMPLNAQRLLALSLQPGDQVRSTSGLVWITVDGEPRDIVLDVGERFVVSAAAVHQVSALGTACASVATRGPLRWQRVGADRGLRGFGRWRALVASALGRPAYNRALVQPGG